MMKNENSKNVMTFKDCLAVCIQHDGGGNHTLVARYIEELERLLFYSKKAEELYRSVNIDASASVGIVDITTIQDDMNEAIFMAEHANEFEENARFFAKEIVKRAKEIKLAQ